jgi:hypothetical protein
MAKPKIHTPSADWQTSQPVDLLNPNTGEPYGSGTVAQVHRIGGQINSLRIHRDTGIDAVVRPSEVRKK